MATSTQEWIDELKSISVLELSERIKALEEAFGVSAAAMSAAPAAAGRRRRRRGRGRGGADGVRRHPDRPRRQEDPGHQGRPRGHRPRPQGGQGARRRGPQARQGGRRQGRGREAQGRPRGSRRLRRDQVAALTRPEHEKGRPSGPPFFIPSRKGSRERMTGPECAGEGTGRAAVTGRCPGEARGCGVFGLSKG